MTNNVTSVDVFKRSLDAFLGKDMRAWADLCAEDVLVEFPFSPDTLPSRLEGRQAIFEYLQYYPTIIDVHEIDSISARRARPTRVDSTSVTRPSRTSRRRRTSPVRSSLCTVRVIEAESVPNSTARSA